jgi:hypothetical protein
MRHSQTLKAVNLAGCHVDKHGIFATPLVLKLLSHWIYTGIQA